MVHCYFKEVQILKEGIWQNTASPIYRGEGGCTAWPPVRPCPAGAPGAGAGSGFWDHTVNSEPYSFLPKPVLATPLNTPPPTSSSSCLKGCSLAGWGAHPIPELCAPLAPRSPVYAAGEGTVRCASSPAGLELAFHVQCGSP